MKATFVLAAFVGVVGRCSELDLPVDYPWHGAGHGHGHPQPPAAGDEDAGVADNTCGPPGLYKDCDCKYLEYGIVPYTPRYELWSDGAEKDRFIYLPEGTQIDTSNANRWTFPVGTRVYKTFTVKGKKLETRLFEKTAGPADLGDWKTLAYAWDEDQRTVTEVSATGRENVLGTEHNIPSKANCKSCHEQVSDGDKLPVDIVNGFEAIQLNHQGRGWTLQRLIALGVLTNVKGGAPNVTLENARVPGSEDDREALGYLHANCGNCHGGGNPRRGLDLSVRVGNALSATKAHEAACKPLTNWKGTISGEPYVYVIDPGSAETSAVIARMTARGNTDQMPPLSSVGSEVPHTAGIALLSDWIDALDKQCPPLPAPPAPPPPVPTPTP